MKHMGSVSWESYLSKPSRALWLNGITQLFLQENVVQIPHAHLFKTLH